MLSAMAPGVVVATNRAIALAEAQGPAVALAALDALAQGLNVLQAAMLPLALLPLLRRACAFLGLVAFAATLSAQAVSTGTIEGRVFNARRGEYVENARITVDGSGQQVLTDATGQYRLTNVPVGPARGEVVNSADVAAALKSGALRGYASDVLDQEPPPADHPLTNLPNSIITPHIASRTNESVVRQASTAVHNLIAGFRGEKPEGVKNPEVPFKKHF